MENKELPCQNCLANLNTSSDLPVRERDSQIERERERERERGGGGGLHKATSS